MTGSAAKTTHRSLVVSLGLGAIVCRNPGRWIRSSLNDAPKFHIRHDKGPKTDGGDHNRVYYIATSGFPAFGIALRFTHTLGEEACERRYISPPLLRYWGKRFLVGGIVEEIGLKNKMLRISQVVVA